MKKILIIAVAALSGCSTVEQVAVDVIKDQLNKTNVVETTTTTTTPGTTTTTVPAAGNDALDLKNVEWLTGKNPLGAQVTVKASNLWLEGVSIHLDWEAHDWGPNDGCDGSWNVIWEREGKLYGCYIEWCPAGKEGYTAPDPLKGIYHNSGNKPFPVKGDKVWAFIQAKDGSKRSNIVGPGEWPINDDGETPQE